MSEHTPMPAHAPQRDLPKGRVLLALAMLTLLPHWCRAADETFVGELALLVEEDVAGQLQLSDEQRTKLGALNRRRESDALELALTIRSLKRDEQQTKLAAFVAETESMARDVLNDEQRRQLRAISLTRRGFSSLSDPAVAEQLNLSGEQRARVARLIAERDQQMSSADDTEQQAIRQTYDDRLKFVLSTRQQGGWQSLLQGVDVPPESVADMESDDNADDSQSGSVDAQGTRDPVAGDGETQIRFNFRYAPWRDVLDWFTEQAGWSLVLDAPPPGTFNYTDNRSYTPAEAIDLMNSVLLTRGYVLVRRERMLLVLNLEDGIPPNLVTVVPVAELERRGEYELVSCLFPLNDQEAEDIQQELSSLIGPQGKLEVLPKSKQILVTETAGRLLTIRDVLDLMDREENQRQREVEAIPLRHIDADEALTIVRQMLGVAEEELALPDGSLRFATDAIGSRIIASGKSNSINQLKKLLETIDQPPAQVSVGGVTETPQLEVYTVPSANPDTVLEVLQTLLADEPFVRLTTDSQSGNLVALATPSQHATIRATIEQMQRDGQAIDVIRLSQVDPQLAVLSINKLFAVGEESGGSAPRVDADVTTGQLLVRGTAAQVQQIRELLTKMGESAEQLDGLTVRDETVRMLPLTGRQADAVLERIEQIWPTLRSNPIRRVTPSSSIRTLTPGAAPLDAPSSSRLPDAHRQEPASSAPSVEAPRVAPPDEIPSGHATHFSGLAELLIARATAADLPAEDSPPPPEAPDETDTARSTEGSEILVAPGPGGLLIASQDLQALNEFEELLLTIASRETSDQREFAVFYLKHATAEAAAEILSEALGSGGSSSSSGGSSDLLGSLASAALGDSGGGLVGSLLGLGAQGVSTVTSSGSLKIIPEPRLNFLIAHAPPDDLALVEQLLQIIDQRDSPEEVETIPAPRMVPILHMPADEVAEVLRQIYSYRLAAAPGEQRQPSPEEFMRALRGGGGRGGDGASSRDAEEQQKLTLGVDRRSNSLLVGAPDSLFAEIKTLVAQLDQATPETPESARVVSVRRANPDLVRQAILALVGQKPATTAAPGATAAPQTPAGNSGENAQRANSANEAARNADAMRQRIEFFRALQQQMAPPRGNRGRGD